MKEKQASALDAVAGYARLACLVAEVVGYSRLWEDVAAWAGALCRGEDGSIDTTRRDAAIRVLNEHKDRFLADVAARERAIRGEPEEPVEEEHHA